MSRLFRRREVWLPTLWGWLLLMVIAAAVGAGLLASALPWLAVDSPAPGARTLVVEGWLNEPELDQAVEAIRRGHYDRVLTSGGPIDPQTDVGHWTDYAERAASYLQRACLPVRR